MRPKGRRRDVELRVGDGFPRGDVAEVSACSAAPRPFGFTLPGRAAVGAGQDAGAGGGIGAVAITPSRARPAAL